VGVGLELHARRPAGLGWNESRATLLRGSYEHGDELADLLLTLEETGPGLLRHVDPYGDTMFDEQQAAAALQEIPELLQRCSGDGQVAAVRNLQTLLRTAAQSPGSHLWFIGD
jgi:hypothetical protein